MPAPGPEPNNAMAVVVSAVEGGSENAAPQGRDLGRTEISGRCRDITAEGYLRHSSFKGLREDR
jgi:hypothetical protein